MCVTNHPLNSTENSVLAVCFTLCSQNYLMISCCSPEEELSSSRVVGACRGYGKVHVGLCSHGTSLLFRRPQTQRSASACPKASQVCLPRPIREHADTVLSHGVHARQSACASSNTARVGSMLLGGAPFPPSMIVLSRSGLLLRSWITAWT